MRIYRLPLNALALSTSQCDLFAITTGANLPAVLEEIILDPCDVAILEYTLSLDLFTGTYTAGSGGSTLTPVVTDPADAAATFTVKTQNTTKTLVGTGVKTTKDSGRMQLVNGWTWQPLSDKHRILIPVSSCLALALNTTPASQTLSGRAIVSEGAV